MTNPVGSHPTVQKKRKPCDFLFQGAQWDSSLKLSDFVDNGNDAKSSW